MIHGFLRSSYWAENVPFEVVERACRHSTCFGLHHARGQVGFARAVSDRARFAWLADVLVLPEHRGLARLLVSCALAHPELHGLRWLLDTRDAHALYTRLDFHPRRARPLHGDPGGAVSRACPGPGMTSTPGSMLSLSP